MKKWMLLMTAALAMIAAVNANAQTKNRFGDGPDSTNCKLYLDYYQTSNPTGNGEPLGIGGCLPLSKCYSFDPYDQLSEPEQKKDDYAWELLGRIAERRGGREGV